MGISALAEELVHIEARGLLRGLRPITGAAGAEVEIDGRSLLMLASNNYLGLATHPALRAAAADAVQRYGAGSGASRLVAGDLTLHHDLEARIARFKHAEAALLFTSGYHANIGTIPTLVGAGDAVFSDALNHASIVDGCRLSRARTIVFPHRDIGALERLLATTPARRRLIVTDSVFSMDGDIAPLPEIVGLAGRFDAWVMLDEAHATGVFGRTGAGAAEALGLLERPTAPAVPVIQMGTLGKALGGFGAYIAGSRTVIDLLINRARSFIYTTALPPATVAAAGAALEIVVREPARRQQLWARAAELRAGLAELGFDVRGESHIVPLFVGENAAALELADAVCARGVFVRAIRPPTVPEGTARLRLTPMATHTEAQIVHAVAAFAGAGRECGLLSRPRPVACPAAAGAPPAAGEGRSSAPAALSAAGGGGRWIGGDTEIPSRPGGLVALLARWDHSHLWHPFTQMADWLADEPLLITAAEGSYLIDAAGHRYLDGVSSLWCNVHGHRHPAIDSAVRAQLGCVAHTTLLGLASEPSIRLAHALVTRAPRGLTRVFYSDAGATAVEVALRMALQYWQLRGRSDRTEFASLVGAYHGDTLGAVGVGYSDAFHRFVRPAVRPALRLTPPHVFRWERRYDPGAALAAAIEEAQGQIGSHADRLAAVIVEPLMQGAAGMWAHPVEYLAALRAITARHGVLLVCDEVATGFGRTGRLFACEHAGITPDLLCLGKGLSGGYLPLAATLATEDIFSAFLGRHEDYVAFFHGHTFTGNPLACAAGLASLGVFDDERVLDRLPALVAQLRGRLESAAARHPHIGDVRQWGLMVGLELVRDRETRAPYAPAEKVGIRIAREIRRRGVILRPLGDVVVLMPPLSISSAELDMLLDATLAAVDAVTGRAP
jgi:adenosylmethionine-8-amino-7-oxononanoate aminotransferase